jgi:hypothetical protein
MYVLIVSLSTSAFFSAIILILACPIRTAKIALKIR